MLFYSWKQKWTYPKLLNTNVLHTLWFRDLNKPLTLSNDLSILSQVMWFVKLEISALFAAYSLLILLIWLPIFYNVFFLFIIVNVLLFDFLSSSSIASWCKGFWMLGRKMTKFSKSL